jgi:hypothetical protein
MMKISIPKHQEQSLKNYCLAAGVFLYMHQQLDAEIIYTDIDPDLIINDDGEAFGIDMNNDGNFDFAFLKASWSFSTYYSENRGYVTQLWCGAYGTSANEIAARLETIGSAASTTFTQQFPYNISAGILINSDYEFQNDGYQLMAAREFNEDGNLIDDAGYWWPVFEDRYIGVHFIDAEEDYHYGWIRCSVLDSIETLIIKDYAFESVPEKAIYAGDTIGTYTNLYATAIKESDFWCYQNQLIIHINSMSETPELYITSLSGALVYHQHLNDPQQTISLQQIPKGIYLATIKTTSGQITKKITII